jgi:hypothetical protein
MQIVIGHKNLNLEELFTIAAFPAQSEVVIDNVISAELTPQHKQPESTVLQ